MAFGNLFELGLHIKADGLEDAKKAFAVVGKGGEEVVRASKAQQREINKGINLLRQMAAAVDKNDKKAIAGLERLAAEQKQWTIAVGGTTSQLLRLSAVERNIADMADHANKSSLAFGKLKGVLATLGIGISVGAVVGLFKSAIEEANDAESAMSELSQAVENVGGNFKLLKPQLDAAATGMQRTTRFSDDLTRRALATMIRVSGDTAGSLKNIGLAADVAAAKHIDLNEAAELIARTMTGNTRALRQFGIQTNDAAKGIELLRERVRGFAEKDGATFQGRLEQVKNAWLDVLEAFGKAVTGADSIPAALEVIRLKLVDLSNFIDQNAGNWRNWAAGAIKWVQEVEERLKKVERVAHAIYRFTHPGSEPKTAFNDVTGGASTGVPAGDTIAPMVIGSNTGNNTPPPPNTGRGTTSRQGSLIPSFNWDTETIRAAREQAAQNIADSLSNLSVTVSDDVGEGIKKGGENVQTALTDWQQTMIAAASDIAFTVGDAFENAFAAAFSGEGIGGALEAFGKTIVAGLGNVFKMIGEQVIAGSAIMIAIKKALLSFNPVVSLAAGIALVALGSAMGAAVSHSAQRGFSSFPRGANESTGELVRLKFVDRPTASTSIAAVQPIHFTIIGENDPKAQRMIGNIVEKNQRRKG